MLSQSLADFMCQVLDCFLCNTRFTCICIPQPIALAPLWNPTASEFLPNIPHMTREQKDSGEFMRPKKTLDSKDFFRMYLQNTVWQIQSIYWVPRKQNPEIVGRLHKFHADSKCPDTVLQKMKEKGKSDRQKRERLTN